MFSFQPLTLLDVVKCPVVMEKLCDCLDVASIAVLEQSCILLRRMVVENKVYRRKVSAAIRAGAWTSGGWLRKTEEDPNELNISNYFRDKLLKNSRR